MCECWVLSWVWLLNGFCPQVSHPASHGFCVPLFTSVQCFLLQPFWSVAFVRHCSALEALLLRHSWLWQPSKLKRIPFVSGGRFPSPGARASDCFVLSLCCALILQLSCGFWFSSQLPPDPGSLFFIFSQPFSRFFDSRFQRDYSVLSSLLYHF